MLAVMRYFFKHDFDVIAISQWKYTREATVSHRFVVDHLEKMGLIYLAESHTLDDVVALEMAYSTDGVVISNDLFEDHMQFSPRFAHLYDRCISMKLDKVKPSERYTKSLDDHYIAEHIFGFQRRRMPSLSSSSVASSLHDVFFSTPDNPRHEIVQEHRESWTPQYRDRIISAIDELLTRIGQPEPSPPLPACTPSAASMNACSCSSEAVPVDVPRPPPPLCTSTSLDTIVNRPQPLLYRHSAGVSRRQSRVLSTLQSKRKRSNSLTNYQKTWVSVV
ncbi:unnamed protein product [Heligmosomoides polygyrus]|uniref:RNase NYN domain-containing protein n=1 Tax=Heligmosomoides polygyrus TaxID=6339 RepID=A0A3P8DT08_HELPZ|nr:unnamed protein product [Heligmosomoides polygyrus]